MMTAVQLINRNTALTFMGGLGKMGTFGPLGSTTAPAAASGSTAGRTCGPAAGGGALPAASSNIDLTPRGRSVTSLSFSSSKSSLSDHPEHKMNKTKVWDQVHTVPANEMLISKQLSEY